MPMRLFLEIKCHTYSYETVIQQEKSNMTTPVFLRGGNKYDDT